MQFDNSITFGNDYNYKDLVQTCAFYAIEDLGTLNRGIDGFKSNEYQDEFITDMDWKDILKLYNKTLKELKKDAANYYQEVKRKTRTLIK